jgi:hypothetical protein
VHLLRARVEVAIEHSQQGRTIMAESPKMLMEKEGPLGWITFNQPEQRNAVS